MSGKRLMLADLGLLTVVDDVVPTFSIEPNDEHIRFTAETTNGTKVTVSVWDDGDITVVAPSAYLMPSEAALLGQLLIQVADGGYEWAREVSA